MSITINHKFVSAKADSTDATLINPSNWNDTHSVTDSTGLVWSQDYNFTARSAANALTAGITNTVVLASVPAGVNGTDTNHYLYISGGTGTAEAVLITGGTAVSGAASGTITFVPANNHSGVYSISSATAGIQEAIVANPWTIIDLPIGVLKLYAAISIDPTKSCTLRGRGVDQSGLSSTVLQPQDTTGLVNAINIIQNVAANESMVLIKLQDFCISAANNRQCGAGINAKHIPNLKIYNLYILQMGTFGISLNQCIYAHIQDCVITHINYHGINLDNACNVAKLDHCYVTDCSYTDGYSGIALGASLGAGNEHYNVEILDCIVESMGHVTNAYGVSINYAFATVVNNLHCEVATLSGGYHLYAGGATVKGLDIINCFFQDGRVWLDGFCSNVLFGACKWLQTAYTTGLVCSMASRDTLIFNGQQTVTAGVVSFDPKPSGTVAAALGSATLSAQKGLVTSEALTTAAAGTYTLTLTNSMIVATSYVGVTLQNGTNNQGIPRLRTITPGAGSVVVLVDNQHASQAFNGTIKFGFNIVNIS